MAYRLLLISETVPFPTVRTLPGNVIAGHAPDILVHTCLANGKTTPAGPIEWGYGVTTCTGNILSATSPGPFSSTTFYRIWYVQTFSSPNKSDKRNNPRQYACLFPHTCYINWGSKGSRIQGFKGKTRIQNF